MCKGVEVLAAVSWRLARPSGPIFLYQDRSIRWEAIFCPLLSRLREAGRCIKWLKYPSMDEKFRYWVCFGWAKVCVMVESSRARMTPRVVMVIAVIFVRVGMVIGSVFVGTI